jgi:cell division protein FtsL
MTEKKPIKKRNRKIRVEGVIFVAFLCTFVLYLASCIFLRSYNVSLDLARQDYEQKIVEVKKENEVLSSEIRELSTYDRIITMVDSDMYVDENAVFVVSE